MSNEDDPGEYSVGNFANADVSVISTRRWLKPRWLVVVALAAALIAFGVFQGVTSSPSTQLDQLSGPKDVPAINFVLPSVTAPHRSLSLSSFQGRSLVINFWASWCVPCRTEMPLLEEAYRSEKGKVEFVGIDTNDTPAAARAFLAKVHVTYPVASDTRGSLSIKYGLFGLPTTIFVSPSGKDLGRHIGQFFQSTLRTALHQAFR